jgi:hypothetical protein
LYALPEGDKPGDVLRGRQRCGIVPRRVFVFLTVDGDVVVTGGALPSAFGVGLALLEILPMKRAWRELVVPFDHLGPVGLGQDDTIPDGLHDVSPLGKQINRLLSKPPTRHADVSLPTFAIFNRRRVSAVAGVDLRSGEQAGLP